MLHPDSFNPNFDTRLHKYFSNRIKKSFDSTYMSPEELSAAKGNKKDEITKQTFNESVHHENDLKIIKQEGLNTGSVDSSAMVDQMLEKRLNREAVIDTEDKTKA